MGSFIVPVYPDHSGRLPVALADLDDATLARAAMLGDPRAPREIWQRFVPLVRRIVRRSLGPEYDVEDVVQDVFLRLFDKIRSLREPASLRAFLVSIAVLSVRYELRRRRVRRLVGLSPAPELDELRVVSADHESRQALVRFYRLLDRLRSRERAAFVLRFVEGMDIEEVAAALELSVPTTRRSLTRAWERVNVLARGDVLLAGYLQLQKAPS